MAVKRYTLTLVGKDQYSMEPDPWGAHVSWSDHLTEMRRIAEEAWKSGYIAYRSQGDGSDAFAERIARRWAEENVK